MLLIGNGVELRNTRSGNPHVNLELIILLLSEQLYVLQSTDRYVQMAHFTKPEMPVPHSAHSEDNTVNKKN